MRVEETDEILIANFLEGDELAFNKLYRKYKVTIGNMISFYTNNKADIDEITSQTFFAFLKQIKTFNPSLGNVEGLLKTIAKRKSADHLREKYKATNNLKNISISELKEESSEKLVSSYDLSAEFQSKDKIERARVLIAQLSPKYREIAIMYFMEQMDQQEISKELNLDYDVVRTRIYRIRKHLRENL